MLNFFLALFLLSWLLITYAYLLFPLILAAFARLAPQRPQQARPPLLPAPRVALIVAAYNEEPVLAAKLRNIAEIDYPKDRLEALIGSDGSTDGTNLLLQNDPSRLTRPFLFPQRRGKVSVLNDLVKNTQADILVMSDANTLLAPDAVQRLVDRFQDPRIGCVSGELSLEQEGGVSGEGLYWKYESWIKRCESRLGFLIGSNGGIFAMRREFYAPLPPSTIVEDFVLTLRVLEQGRQVAFAPEARATEPACATARAEMVRKIRIGAGGWQALTLTYPMLHPRHGLCAFAFWGHKVVRWMVPFFLLTALAGNAGLLCFPALRVWSVPLLAMQLGGIAVAGAAYLRPGGRDLPRILRPLGYFYLMNYSLLCGFFRFIVGKQQVTWERARPAEAVIATPEKPQLVKQES